MNKTAVVASAEQGESWPRRRATDHTRMSPVRRLFYESLLAAALLPFLLVWLTGRGGLWHADALAHDLMLAHSSAPPAQDVVVISLDEPCPPTTTACASVPMRYQVMLEQLAGHRPRAVLLDTGPLHSGQVRELLRAVGQAPDAARVPLPTIGGGWAEVDRDGITRRVQAWRDTPHGREIHPTLLALGMGARAADWPALIDLRWHIGSEAIYPTLSYVGLLLDQYPTSALAGKIVVIGPRHTQATHAPWLVRAGSGTHMLAATDAQAQLVDNLTQQRWVHPAGPLGQWWWMAWPLWLLVWLSRRWPEHIAPAAIGLIGLTVAASWYALEAHRLWLPVASAVTGLLVFQLLWYWRRGAALGELFRHRIDRLQSALAQTPGERDPRAEAATRSARSPARAQVEVLDDTLDRLEAQHQIQRRMQQQRDRWLAFLSHDLRAPQSNILSLLELRERGVEGMNNERLFAGVRVQVDRTLNLAEGFVDLLRAESDHLNQRQCALGSLTVEAIDRCWPLAKTRGVTIEHRGAGDGQAPVYGDPELLTRALVNMLGNALRHSQPGSTVEVCVAHDTVAEQVAWSVRDHGAGMTEEQLQALMSALDSHTWVRPRTPPGQDGHGLGLGLLVARTVVSRHQGEMHAMAAPGQGSCFVIVLPAGTPPSLHTVLGHLWPPLRSESPPSGTRALPA